MEEQGLQTNKNDYGQAEKYLYLVARFNISRLKKVAYYGTYF
ncbi:MAG: hypothetical protein WEB62_12060 [Bacteroidota bacterium]